MKKIYKSSEIIKARENYGKESARQMTVSFGPVIKLILEHYNQGEKMKKVTVNKAALNEIIKLMSAMQNDKMKLNAGQLREAAKLFSSALVSASTDTQAAYTTAMIKSV
jgi:hypothetical protein